MFYTICTCTDVVQLMVVGLVSPLIFVFGRRLLAAYNKALSNGLEDVLWDSAVTEPDSSNEDDSSSGEDSDDSGWDERVLRVTKDDVSEDTDTDSDDSEASTDDSDSDECRIQPCTCAGCLTGQEEGCECVCGDYAVNPTGGWMMANCPVHPDEKEDSSCLCWNYCPPAAGHCPAHSYEEEDRASSAFTSVATSLLPLAGSPAADAGGWGGQGYEDGTRSVSGPARDDDDNDDDNDDAASLHSGASSGTEDNEAPRLRCIELMLTSDADLENEEAVEKAVLADCRHFLSAFELGDMTMILTATAVFVQSCHMLYTLHDASEEVHAMLETVLSNNFDAVSVLLE